MGVGRCVGGGGGGGEVGGERGKGLGGHSGGHSIWKRVPTVHVVLPLQSSGCRKPRWLGEKRGGVYIIL